MTSMIGPAQPPAATSQRRARVSELQRRRRRIAASQPAVDAALVQAIASNDALWDANESWRTAVIEVDADLASPEEQVVEEPMPQAHDEPTLSIPQVKKPRFRIRRHKYLRQTQQEPLAPSESVPEDLDSIPAPGARRRTRIPGRRQTWIIRTVLVAAPLMLVGGAAFAVGVQHGSDGIAPVASGLTGDEVKAFGLSTFPAAAAAAFGASYVGQCLTHPDPKDRSAVAARVSALSLVTSSAVPAGCGWDGTSGRAQRPSTVAWDGSATGLAGFSQGQAARVGFTAVLSNGQALRVVVPIWSSGESFRVIGTLGLLPAPPAAAAPQPEATVEDPALASALPSAVLKPFLKAWATSDRVQLGLLLTNDATSAARQGAAGALGVPAITDVAVTVLTGSPGAYREGDQVVALTTVTWSMAGSDQVASYTIRLRSEASRWLVDNITGATVDKSGGTARPLPPAGK